MKAVRVRFASLSVRTLALAALLASGGCPSARAQTTSVTRGPYLQLGTPTSVVVRWRTGSPTDSRVRYGSAPSSLTSSAGSSTLTTEHVVDVSGLLPSTKFFYSVGTSSQTLAGGTSSYFFVTSPPAGASHPTRVWVLGDSGTADDSARAVRNAYQTFTGTAHTDLWLMLGDNAYDSGTDAEYQAAVFDMYPDMLRKSVLWPTLGNHDGGAADSRSQSGPYYNIFTLPRSGEAGGRASGTEAYYSFDFGNIHFICLESFETDRRPGGAMLTWLDLDLASTTQEWVIAFWHHPPYSKGSHDSDNDRELVEMRENAVPILERHGVDLVLSGHSHSYERSFLIDGHYGRSSTFSTSMVVDGGDGRAGGDGAYTKPAGGSVAHAGAVYVVAGSSGKTSGGDLDHPVMFLSLDILGSMVLELDGPRLDVLFLDSRGAVKDSFTMVKDAGSPTPPPPPPPPPSPPSPPSDLAAEALSGSEIRLTWTDHSTDETQFLLERSLDGTSWSEAARAGADATSHVDRGLTRLTTYHYRVRALNQNGVSDPSNEDSATTLGTSDALAADETMVAGAASGDFSDTWSADGAYESIQEETTRGKGRISSLEVVWSFEVAGGSAVTFFVKAHQSRSRDGDSFVFSWSAGGSPYSDLLTVTRTVDDGTYQSASLPASVTGPVSIRATDTHREPGARGRDTLRVDHMFIRSE